MKHFLAVLVIAFSVSGFVNAQTNFGIRGGTSLTFFNEDNGVFGENPETEVGYFGGVFLILLLTKAFISSQNCYIKVLAILSF